MAASARKHFDPPKSHEQYTLHIPQRSSDEPVFICATPLEGAEYIIENTDDSKFNLSDHLGLNPHTKTLEWGLSGFQIGTNNITIRKYGGPQRYLSVELDTGETRALNLDECLGLAEYYDETTGEIRTKLCRKQESSKARHTVHALSYYASMAHQIILVIGWKNTNVVKLVELLKKDDPLQQMVYYQAGVGTYSSPGLLTGVGQTVAATADKAIAWYLYQHVIDGYRYLMESYRAGDQISIFGFSRGAYTARALAGMLHSVGLLPMHNLEQMSFAYQVYSESKERDELATSGEESEQSTSANFVDGSHTHSDIIVKFTSDPKDIDPRSFKRAFCTPIVITFLGVWDTVGSVGAFKRKTLPYIEYNPSVKYFRQALALDENRGNFIPSVWDHSKTIRGQSVLEVWFKGGHVDIGGGADPAEDFIPDDVAPREPIPRLSNIALRWMIRQCHTPGVQILFDPKTMRHYRKHGILAKRELEGDDETFQKAIADLDERDVVQEPFIMQDEWSMTGWGWYILDKLPLPKPSQEATSGSQPTTAWMPNNGAARIVNFLVGGHIRLHASVCTHLQKFATKGGKKGKGYLPAAEWHGWKENEWPTIEGGDMYSIMSPQDRISAPVRDALIMSWKPKPEAKGVVGTVTNAAKTVGSTLKNAASKFGRLFGIGKSSDKS